MDLTPQAGSLRWNIICFLHGIIDDSMELHMGVLYLYLECWQWWKWHKNSHRGYIAWTQFSLDLYECFETNTYYLGQLTKLKQSGIIKEFISSFEQFSILIEGMYDTFSRISLSMV